MLFRSYPWWYCVWWSLPKGKQWTYKHVSDNLWLLAVLNWQLARDNICVCVCVCRRNNCEQNVSVIAIIYLPWEIVQQASHRKQPCVDHLVVRPILGMQVHQSLCVEWCPAHEKCYHNGSCNENAIKTYRCVSKKCCWDARRTSSSQWYRMCACHVVSTNTKLTTNYHILLSKGFKRTERGLNWKISFCVCVWFGQLSKPHSWLDGLCAGEIENINGFLRPGAIKGKIVRRKL